MCEGATYLTMGCPSSASTHRGVAHEYLLPCPSAPDPPNPHEKTHAACVSSSVCCQRGGGGVKLAGGESRERARAREGENRMQVSFGGQVSLFSREHRSLFK